jgi:SAM-dependent methyltransferase
MSEMSYGMGLSNEWSDEQRRLAAMEWTFDRGTFRHLGTLGIAPGMRCLEVGAGSGSVARWMADSVGPSGSVVVTDIDVSRLVGCDRENIEVRVHDICADSLEEASFDLVHARLVLEHLPERLMVLDKLVQALRPRGWLLVEDFDLTALLHLPEECILCEPKSVFTTLQAGMRAAVELGHDGEFGRDLPLHLARAGLEHLGGESCAPLIVGGSPEAEFQALGVRQLKPILVSRGVETDEEADQLADAFEKPSSMFGWFPIVSAWGQRID